MPVLIIRVTTDIRQGTFYYVFLCSLFLSFLSAAVTELLSRHSRHREQLSASVLSVCSSVCLFVYRQNAKKCDFLKN